MQKGKTKTEKGLFPPTIPGLSAIKQVNPLKTDHPSKKNGILLCMFAQGIKCLLFFLNSCFNS